MSAPIGTITGVAEIRATKSQNPALVKEKFSFLPSPYWEGNRSLSVKRKRNGCRNRSRKKEKPAVYGDGDYDNGNDNEEEGKSQTDALDAHSSCR
jgi:hypothetical protein